MKQKKIHFSIWYFIVAMGVLMLFQYFFLAREQATISYSEFKALVREGQVGDLLIAKDSIRGKLGPGAAETLAKMRAGEKDKTAVAQLVKEKTFYSVRMEDPDLIKELEANRIKFTAQPEMTWLTTLLSWVVPIFIFVAIWGYFLRRMRAGAEGGFMAIGKSKAKVYVEDETKITFEDVAGVDEAEEELKEVIEFLRNPGRFQSLGGKIPKGVLLVGPPGTGKTLLAKAVAGEAKVPFLSLSGSSFVEMFVGVGAARVRDLFAQAEEKAPCIIFIDEIDALGKARGISPVSGVDEREQTLTQLLSELDGFDTKKGVIIMAATNRPEILDPALLRPGRFDRHVLVDRPDLKGREAILKVHARRVKVAPDVDIKIMAARTPGMVGADLANVVNEAALLAARKNKSQVEMSDFEEAVDRVMAGLEKKSRLITKKEKEVVAYHESGHALVAMSLPHADPVHRVSIIPRGIAALGYTLQLPTEDRYLMTKSELMDKITVLLGGRVSEEITFGEVSTGAQNDLFKTMDIARSMVTEYGMSDALGPLTFGRERRPLFLEIMLPQTKEYSEETARQIDDEVRKLIGSCYERAKEILTEKKEKLDMLSKLLLEKEVVEGEELKKLVA
ncbi:MAG: ATP-dependent zinc metalloprotease FtsH [Thermodesulfobacteriota bacterium]